MKLPDHIAQAAEDHGYAQASPRDKASFMAGVSWLFAHLAEISGGFDENAAWDKLAVFECTHDRSYRGIGVSMARWQHEQDRARIALAESAKACVLVHHGKLETENAELKAKIAEANKVILEGLHIVDEEGYF